MNLRPHSMLIGLVVCVAACAGGTVDTSATTATTEAETNSSAAPTTLPEAGITTTSTNTSSSSASGRLTAFAVGDSDSPLGYYEYLPPGYGDGEPRPLLIALHGGEAGGDGSREQLDNIFETGIPQLIQSDSWPEERPFVVLMPQHVLPNLEGHPCLGAEAYVGTCLMKTQSDDGHPADSSVCTTPGEVATFLSYALDSYDIDSDRVYLTGLSCGGYAIYEYLSQYGGADVTAVVPIAADARPAWEAVGCALGEVPIWAFIGDADGVVEPQGTIEPLTALQDCADPAASEVELTVYPGIDHDSWVATYDLSAGNDIYTWLLEHE